MKDLINNRWLLLNYFNSANLKETNGQVARFILENPLLFENKTLTHIGETSCFSEPTLSRFFNNVCYATYSSFKKNDLITKRKFEKSLVNLPSIMKESRDMYSYLQDSQDILFSKDTIKWLTDKIINARRVLILGPSSLLSFSVQLQNILLYFNKLIYLPSNYYSQLTLIQEMNEFDLVITESSSFAWLDSSIVYESVNRLRNTPCDKVVLCLANTEPPSDFQIDNTITISLTNKPTFFFRFYILFVLSITHNELFLGIIKKRITI